MLQEDYTLKQYQVKRITKLNFNIYKYLFHFSHLNVWEKHFTAVYFVYIHKHYFHGKSYMPQIVVPKALPSPGYRVKLF